MRFNIVRTIACLAWQADTPQKQQQFEAMRRKIMNKAKGGEKHGNKDTNNTA